jgi:hypothetical protein
MPTYFNGGTVPLVPEGKWGEGVIMPGEPYTTDAPLGPPWTLDSEAEADLASDPQSPVKATKNTPSGEAPAQPTQ